MYQVAELIIFSVGKSDAVPKADDFRRHEDTTDHKFAVSAQCSVEAKEMSIAASKAFDSVKEVIVHTMINVYFIIQEDLPKEKLASLNKHCIIQVSCCKLSLQIIIYHAYYRPTCILGAYEGLTLL